MSYDFEEGEFSMDKVAEIVRTKYGVDCWVNQTGGGCATIHAGKPYLDAEGNERYPAVAGPGSFSYDPEIPSTGSVFEFYLGSDNDGESEAWSAESLTDYQKQQPVEEVLALMIYAQTFVDGIMNSIREDIEGGTVPFDVEDFSALHDHLDANDYLIDAQVPFGNDTFADGTEAGIDLTAYVQELVDIRIKAGELREAAVDIEIENVYSNGTFTNEVTLRAPRDENEIENWWQRVFIWTGDSRGHKGHSTATATIVKAHNPALVGLSHTWEG